MNPETTRVIKLSLIGIIAGVAAYLCARPFLPHPSDHDWDHTAAVFPEQGAPTAIIHGWASSPIAEVRYTLLWKTSDDKWAVYELDPRGAAWDKYKIQASTDALMVVLNGKAVDLLDLNKGELKRLREKHTDPGPTATIHGANLDSEKQWVYYPGGK